jgi:DNA-binding winged helix-turn-helix (wHTH) protein
MKQIRAALGDSRSAPGYVETLVKRGFRFIPDVTVVNPLPGSGATLEPSRSPNAWPAIRTTSFIPLEATPGAGTS